MRILPIILLSGLTSCAYIAGGEATQEINVKLASQTNVQANCYFENNEFKKEVVVPSVTRVQQSHLAFNVYCRTANGPELITTVASYPAPATYWNVFNGVLPGGTFDYVARTAFKYPDDITLDFEPVSQNTVSKAAPLSYKELKTGYGEYIEDNNVVYEAPPSTYPSEPLGLITPTGRYISRDNSR